MPLTETQSMKICLVLLRTYPVFRPETNERFGGAEVQFYLLSRALTKFPGLQITVVSNDFGQPDHETIDGVILRKFCASRKGLAGRKPLRKLFASQALNRVLEEVNADVYLQSCAGIETGLVARFCKKHGKHFVFCAASDIDLDGRFEKDNSLWMARFFRYGMTRTSLVICQTELQQKLLKERFDQDGVVLPYLCDVPLTYCAPSGNSILWVSRLLPMKRPEIFFDLARRNPECKFVMVAARGPDDKYFDQVLREAEGIANLEVHSEVAYQQMDRFFSEAILFVGTSEFEGFPNTYLQAMSHGVPLLSLAVNPGEILTRHNTGYLANNDIDKFFGLFQQHFSDSEQYSQKSQAAWNYVREFNASDMVAESYRKLLHDLIQSK